MAIQLINPDDKQEIVTDIDLTGTDSIRNQPFFRTQDVQRGRMKESGAKTVAVILVSAFAVIIPITILVSAALTAFASLADAQGFVGTVATLLEAATRFMSVAIWPPMAYYFLKEYKGRS